MRIIRSGQQHPKARHVLPAFKPELVDEFLPPRGARLYWHLYWLAEHNRAQPGLQQLAADLRLAKSDVSELLRRMERIGAIRAHRARVYRGQRGILWIEIVATGKRTRAQGTLFWPVALANRKRDAELLRRPG